MFRPFRILLLALTATVAHAGDDVPLEFEGELIQGAIVIGRTDPQASVRFDDRPLRVGPDGHFVIGFDRDAPVKQSLAVTLPAGRRIERELEIARRDYDIQHIDGLKPEQVSPPPEAIERILRDVEIVKKARERDDPRQDFLQEFRWPLIGRITGVYGSQRVLNGEPKRPHYGIDIAAPAGTVVRAPAAGIVTVAEPDMYYSGGTIVLDHGHGLSSAFLHMRRLAVEVGQRVERGEPLGEVGATGRSTGAHLDWRVNLFERRLDPRFLVGPMPEEVADES